jgi:hypothetical protein
MFEIDSFYLIVLSIAVIILIIALGFMGWMLSHQKDDIKFPGITTTCPDFWTISQDGKRCEQPAIPNFNRGTIAPASGVSTNVFDAYKKPGTTTWGSVPGKSAAALAGSYTINSFDSNDMGWGSGNEAICNKKKWATDNKINWDTVTNVNFC